MKKSLIVAALLSASAYSCGPVAAQSAYSFDVYGHHVDIAVPRHCADISCISVWASPGGGGGEGRHTQKPTASVKKPRAAKARPAPKQPQVAAPPQTESPAQDAPVAARPSAPAPAPTTEAKKPLPSTPAAKGDPAKTEAAAPAPKPDVAAAPSAPKPETPKPETPKQAETKPAAPPVAPDTAPGTQTKDLVRRADSEPADVDVASGRSSSEDAKPGAAEPTASQAPNPPEQDTQTAANAVLPLPAAERDRITTALAEPTAAGPDEAANDTATSPLGFWITELYAEKVHITPCGTELCGYLVDPKTDQDRSEPVVRMKAIGAGKWSGRIDGTHGTGSYASTISQEESDILHIEGCAFKGFLCDGQIWRRAS